MKEIITAQRNFFNTHATKNIHFRRAQLKTLQKALEQNEALLHEAIYNDFKKSEFDNYTTELSLLYRDIKEARKMIFKWARKENVSTGILNFPASSYIIPEPLGVCLVIGAWNYPYQLSFAPIIAAITAGNTVILKPSELPTNTAAAMAKIVKENFDPAFFTVVEGGVEETQELLKQKFDKMFFTGSTKVGKIVYKAAAENLTPVTLELGGKSPAIVTENCNLKISVKRLVWGKFLNSGQTCIAPDYVLVHKSIEKQFLEQTKKEIESQHFAFENDNYLQIINSNNFERLTKMLVKEKIYYGGETNVETRCIQPTIMQNVTLEDAVMQEEIFGPILPVITYETIEEAIALVNSLPKPLSCYLFTKSSSIKKKVLKEISFGGGAINETVMHITNENLPFGGVGHSGMGNYHGEAGFKTFTHYKSVMDKPTWLDPSIRYYPHSPFRLKLMRRFMKF
ncbi:NAD-dependent aldehyde dehydrogenase [Aequorivita sublithincola DSM 14238]|uniref:Aldehyde dehydrogenase n=1 Tax=Aequorivita sublithincola (strain DSM 14238 / LMG 21431 / ACAM 643 / 9-3) TaxID=746697 RepID=I3YRY5_AEQSU|nr:aldehyde dehydrogenase [Aequorivita sublithincola]AFL79753.1 NAD-dependent aldehyde dehydrogenase [Aequorivita sublithincola DSM 14238]